MPTEEQRKIHDIRDQLTRWNELRNEIAADADFDEEIIVNSLLGSTDLETNLLALADEIAERETISTAITLHIKTLQDRQTRIERTADTLRSIILQAMDISGLRTVPGVTATLSVNTLDGEIKVVDESLIPPRFWVKQDPKLDKKALNSAVKSGEPVAGVERGNGRISLTIRRK